MSDIWKIYGIRYTTQPSRPAHITYMFGDPNEETGGLDYYSWVLISDDRAIVVDTGAAEHKVRKLGRQWLDAPTNALKRLGVDPAHVEDMIISHAHWDHVGDLKAYPKARFFMNDLEMASITGPDMTYDVLREPYHGDEATEIAGLVYEDRLTFIQGDGTFAPGIDYTLIGGHSAGQLVLTVKTERGPVILATDAIHFWQEVEKERAFIIFHDLRKMLAGYRRLNTMAGGDMGRLLPGHDPLIKTRYPVVETHADGSPFILDLGAAPTSW